MSAERFFNAARVLSKRFKARTFRNTGIYYPPKPVPPKPTLSLGLLSMASLFVKTVAETRAENANKDLEQICLEREELLTRQMEALAQHIVAISNVYRRNIWLQIRILKKAQTQALSPDEDNELNKLRDENKQLKEELERCRLLCENMPNTVFCQGLASIWCKAGNPDELCLCTFYKFEMAVYAETKMNEAVEYHLYKAAGIPLPEDWGKPKMPTIPLHFVFPH